MPWPGQGWVDSPRALGLRRVPRLLRGALHSFSLASLARAVARGLRLRSDRRTRRFGSPPDGQRESSSVRRRDTGESSYIHRCLTGPASESRSLERSPANRSAARGSWPRWCRPYAILHGHWGTSLLVAFRPRGQNVLPRRMDANGRDAPNPAVRPRASRVRARPGCVQVCRACQPAKHDRERHCGMASLALGGFSSDLSLGVANGAVMLAPSTMFAAAALRLSALE